MSGVCLTPFSLTRRHAQGFQLRSFLLHMRFQPQPALVSHPNRAVSFRFEQINQSEQAAIVNSCVEDLSIGSTPLVDHPVFAQARCFQLLHEGILSCVQLWGSPPAPGLPICQIPGDYRDMEGPIG